jgi:hypothetical protein
MSSNSSKNLLTANELRFHKRLHWQPNKGSWKKSERKLTGQETEAWEVIYFKLYRASCRWSSRRSRPQA